jgi:hypothetical protein
MHPDLRDGLCPSCQHVRTVTSARGSMFLLCDRSKADARFPRYPRLPVARCDGYDEQPESIEPPPP